LIERKKQEPDEFLKAYIEGTVRNTLLPILKSYNICIDDLIEKIEDMLRKED